MKCKFCDGKLIPKRQFCPDCGKANEKVSIRTSGSSSRPADVNKVLEKSGAKTEAEKRRFLGEIQGGFKSRDEAVVDGNVGRVGDFS